MSKYRVRYIHPTSRQPRSETLEDWEEACYRVPFVRDVCGLDVEFEEEVGTGQWQKAVPPTYEQGHSP